MIENLTSQKFTVTFWALNTQFSIDMKVFCMITHQPWLNKLVTYGTLHLTVGVAVQVASACRDGLS